MVEKKYVAEIIQNLAESVDPLSPYDIEEKTHLVYSGIRGNLIRLCNKGYVQKKSTVQSKAGVNRTLYTLTFKGVLRYLSAFTDIYAKFSASFLPTKKRTAKDIDECKRKFVAQHQNDLLNVLERQGKILNYIPFQECRWLSQRSPEIIMTMITNATILLNEPLSGEAKIAAIISKPNSGFDIDNIRFLRDHENLFLMSNFGKIFLLHNVVNNLKEDIANENDKLRHFAELILDENKKEIVVLEQAVVLFSKK